MFDSLGDFLSNLVLFTVIFCGVSALLIAVTMYFIWRWIGRMTEPDIQKIRAEFEKRRVDNPNASVERIVRQMIHRQALRAGAIGAVTSLGGFYTLPIALPVDMVLSARTQATMVDFIAAAYGRRESGDVEARVRQYLVMTGSVAAAERTSGVAMKFVLRMLGKSFAKLIPIVGAVIGFAVNYTIARTTGNLALQWYNKSATLPGKTAP